METVKIRCKTLCVGDWVANRNGSPMQIVAVDEDNAYACEGNEAYACEGNEERPWIFGDDEGYEPEPIILTPEILEKNGFSSETFLTAEWEKEVYFKEFSSCVVEPDESGKYIFGTTICWNKKDGDGSPMDWGTMYDSRICNLQYVHELQRALRLCGLNELADNFKI